MAKRLQGADLVWTPFVQRWFERDPAALVHWEKPPAIDGRLRGLAPVDDVDHQLRDGRGDPIRTRRSECKTQLSIGIEQEDWRNAAARPLAAGGRLFEAPFVAAARKSDSVSLSRNPRFGTVIADPK